MSFLLAVNPRQVRVFPKGVRYWMTFSVPNGSLADPTYSPCVDETEGVIYLSRWIATEGARGVYNFSSIRNALDYVGARGKKLILRMFYKSYDFSWPKPVPIDIVNDHITYGGTPALGGVVLNSFGGYTARFDNDQVRSRYYGMLSALADEIAGHPALFGVAPDESAWSIPSLPSGLTSQRLIDLFLDHLAKLRELFPTQIVFPYVNYLEGSNHERTREVLKQTLALGYAASLTDIFRIPEQLARVQPVAPLYPLDSFTLASIDGLSYGNDEGLPALKERMRENCRQAAAMGANIVAWNTKGGYSGNFWQAARDAMATVI